MYYVFYGEIRKKQFYQHICYLELYTFALLCNLNQRQPLPHGTLKN